MSKSGYVPLQVRRIEICMSCLLRVEIVGMYYGSAICKTCLNKDEKDGVKNEK